MLGLATVVNRTRLCPPHGRRTKLDARRVRVHLPPESTAESGISARCRAKPQTTNVAQPRPDWEGLVQLDLALRKRRVTEGGEPLKISFVASCLVDQRGVNYTDSRPDFDRTWVLSSRAPRRSIALNGNGLASANPFHES